MIDGVSVIIPVYQVQQYLARCLDSVLCQTLPCIEILLVDDGSKDSSGEICDHYAKKDERIKVIHQQNMGLGLARNTGLLHARCAYVAFLDSDDYVAPNMYEILYREATLHHLDFVGSGECMVGPADAVQRRAYVQQPTLFETEQEVRTLLLGSLGAPPNSATDAAYGMSVWKNLYRKEVIDQHGLRFESERQFISEDILFNMEFLFHTKRAAMLPDCLYYYCMNGDSLTKSYRPDRFEKDKMMYAEVARKLQLWGVWEEGRLYANRLIISRGRYNVAREVAAQQAGLPPLRQRVGAICADSVFREAMQGYPVLRLPLMQAVFALLMRCHLVSLQIILVKWRYRSGER